MTLQRCAGDGLASIPLCMGISPAVGYGKEGHDLWVGSFLQLRDPGVVHPKEIYGARGGAGRASWRRWPLG